MNKLIFCFLLILMLPVKSQDYIVKARVYLENFRDLADEYKMIPPEDAIPKLSVLLLKSSQMAHLNAVPEVRQETIDYVSRILKGMPGHAAYHKDRILAFRESVDQAGVYSFGRNYSKYLTERMFSMQTLAELPSPETVGVLGEMLTDEWIPSIILSGRNKDTDYTKTDFLCYQAVATLTRLPLEGKPADTKLYGKSLRADLPAWRLWYAQIKAGTRKIRFVGDPNEYSLTGNGRMADRGSLRPSRHAEISTELSATKVDDQVGILWLNAVFWPSVVGFVGYTAIRIYRKQYR